MNRIIKYVDIVSPRSATGLVGDVYGQAKREVGRLVEGVTMFSSDPELLAATWASFREPLLAAGLAPRISKEAVAATVSRLNECPYCVDAHTIMLYGGGAGTFATELLGGVAVEQLDPRFRSLSRWAEGTATEGTASAAAPFAAILAPEYLGVLVNFHFLNRMINILLAGTFLPGPEGARKIARRVGGKVMASKVAAKLEPGIAPGLPGGRAHLPPDLSWAAPSEPIAAAYAMLASATEAAALRCTTQHVRELVGHTVAGWKGEPPGVSASWADGPLAAIPAADRPAARLALLAALAPYQVTEQDVLAFRAGVPGDRELIGLLSWAVFMACRRIGSWAAGTCQ